MCFAPSIGKAELWKCGKTYSSKKLPDRDCKEIDSGRICGSDGNRYITPAGFTKSRIDKNCEQKKKASSPLVHMPDEQELIRTAVTDSNSPFVNANDLPSDEQSSPDKQSARNDFVLDTLSQALSEQSESKTQEQALPDEESMHCFIDRLYNNGDLNDCGEPDSFLSIKKMLDASLNPRP